MGERMPIETRCELVLTSLRIGGHEGTCTEANVKTAIRQELGIWRSDRLKDFFNYMVDTGYVTLVGAGLYAVKQRAPKVATTEKETARGKRK